MSQFVCGYGTREDKLKLFLCCFMDTSSKGEVLMCRVIDIENENNIQEQHFLALDANKIRNFECWRQKSEGYLSLNAV